MIEKKPNIFVLGLRGFPDIQGGIERHAENLYPELSILGLEVTVFCRKPFMSRKSRHSYMGVKLFPLSCPRQIYLENILHSFKALLYTKKFRGKTLHVHALGPALITPWARLLGIRVVWTTQGPDYNRQKWGAFAKLVLKIGEWCGLHFANEIIAVTSHIEKDLKTRKPNKKIHIIPNGVRIPLVHYSEELLKTWKIKSKQYILFVGRLVPEKGILDLIQAYLKVSLNIHLVIVGEADHETAFSRKIKKEGKKSPSIIFTGFQTKDILYALFEHASLFVLPSYHEGLPLALLEALSFGSRTLLSDIPAHREIGLTEDHYFPPGDQVLLCYRLQQWAHRPLSAKDRKSILKILMEEFSWKKIALQTKEVFEKVWN